MSGEHPETPPSLCVMEMADLCERNVQAALYKALLHLKHQEGMNTRHKLKKNKRLKACWEMEEKLLKYPQLSKSTHTHLYNHTLH